MRKFVATVALATLTLGSLALSPTRAEALADDQKVIAMLTGMLGVIRNSCADYRVDFDALEFQAMLARVDPKDQEYKEVVSNTRRDSFIAMGNEGEREWCDRLYRNLFGPGGKLYTPGAAFMIRR